MKILLLQRMKSVKPFLKNPYLVTFLIAWGAILLGYWRGINNHLPVLGNFTDELEWAIVLVPLIFGSSAFVRRLSFFDFAFVFGCIFFYLLNFVLYPQNENALFKRLFSFTVLTIPYYFIGAALDIKRFYKVFFYVSCVSICICAFYNLSYAKSASYAGDMDVSEYNMSLAYNILQHVLMVSWVALKEMKPWKIGMMILGLFMLLSMGTRGPVVCAIVFIAVYLLFFKPSKYQKTMRAVVISVAVYAISFLDSFMMFMLITLQQLGLSTRIFDKYFDGGLEESVGRDFIRETIIRELGTDNSIFGHGILGSYKYVGTYAHNIILDFLFSFGIVVGTGLLLMLAYLICRAFLRTRHCETEQVFLLLLVIASLLKMCFSGTFIDDTLFFFLIGYCVQICRKQKLRPYENLLRV